MRIIDQKENEALRGKEYKLIGRLKEDIKNNPWIYFQIEEDQQSFSVTEVLDTLTLEEAKIKHGEYIVFHHWTQPEEMKIVYSIPKLINHIISWQN